jgi:transposase
LALRQALSEAGLCELWYLDESGFAPTLPTGYTWARVGARALVWDEPPQGRRLNVLGALALNGSHARLVWTSPVGKIDSAVLLDFVCQQVAHLPAPPDHLPTGYRRAVPCIVALDNASAHTSKVVKAAIPALEAAGVTLFFLPPYSPELNRIEDLWRHVKYEELPTRSFQSLDDLRAAVARALNDHTAPTPDATTNFRKAA